MKKAFVWAGRVISLAPVFICLTSARWKLTHSPFYVREWTRIGEFNPPLVPLTTCLLAWLGLYLREPRLRALIPIRTKGSAT